ncbi:hypothetical protein J4E86_001196 [Alternaria arbusti]|uniref:uncharacterized protein n=1 Tax=Alternaria arbusti TaxID=232088 RepID=UPI00221FBB4A|nr:uncharacterized protein J4E86_001196 [Alternaria arbusti]KAI4962164.1 hypothetical protein J4E86_001196 [Alternaria arbusti]
MANSPNKDAENNAALEQREDVSPVEQQPGIAKAPALTSDLLSRHEPTHHRSTAVHGNADEGASHDSPPTREEHSISRRDIKEYIALVKKDINIKTYHDFLKSKVVPGSWMYQIGPDDKILGYGSLNLTQEAKKEVENHEDTSGMMEELPVISLRALPAEQSLDAVHKRSEAIDRREKLVSRALTWKKQENADDALLMDSLYPGGSLSQATDFVYPENPGRDVYVYLIDMGVQIKVKNRDEESEFTTDNDLVLQSSASIENHQSPDSDDNVDKPSHGTYVASKAVGKKYGLAKEANLVSSKMYPKSGDWENIMHLILRDINSHPGRASRSVVTTSIAIGLGGITPEAAKNDKQMQELYGDDLRTLSKLGVPFVASAGNAAKQPNRKDVDQIPMVLHDDDIPLIIVGGCDDEGNRADFSQAGPLVSIYALGDRVDCQSKVDEERTVASGSSLAAPQVAGLIATYLSYSTKPWDDSKTGVERVKAIRDYVTSEHSSWVRASGSNIRVIWNGATKADHGDDDDDDDDDDESPNDSSPTSPSPVPSATPSRKNKALSIISQNYIDDISNENTWLFFNSDYGESSECRLDTQAMKTVPADGNVDNPPWPAGTYEMGNLIDSSSCDYLNDGTNPGSLWCQDWDAPPTKQGEPALPKDREIKCKAEEVRYKSGAEGCSDSMMGIYRHAVVTCDW